MAGYNPDELNDMADNAEIPDGKAVIESITETTANEVYGEADFDYDPTKVMIEVTAILSADSDVDEVTEVFALPENEASWLNPNFKLAQFKEHYGSVPREDMEVSVSVDDNGLLSIDF